MSVRITPQSFYSSTLGRNLGRKKENIIIKITKDDAFYLRKHGYAESVKKSKSKHPTYYLVEEPDVYGYDRRNKKRYVSKQGALSFYYEYRENLTK